MVDVVVVVDVVVDVVGEVVVAIVSDCLWFFKDLFGQDADYI